MILTSDLKTGSSRKKSLLKCSSTASIMSSFTTFESWSSSPSSSPWSWSSSATPASLQRHPPHLKSDPLLSPRSLIWIYSWLHCKAPQEHNLFLGKTKILQSFFVSNLSEAVLFSVLTKPLCFGLLWISPSLRLNGQQIQHHGRCSNFRGQGSIQLPARLTKYVVAELVCRR